MHWQTVLTSVLSTIAIEKLLPNWISDLTFPWLKQTGKLMKRLFIRTKKQYIIWEHSTKHKGKLRNCTQNPCDILQLPSHDLGLRPLSGRLPVDK
jgi:hypothetical protein